MEKKKYGLLVVILVIVGLVIALALFISVLLIFNVFFTEGIRDLLFFPQFLILGIVFFSIFPVIMILISNLCFKKSGKKSWVNWFKISTDYDGVFSVISIYQAAFVTIEALVSSNIYSLPGGIEKIIIWIFPFLTFFLAKKLLKKLFGCVAEIDASQVENKEEIDTKHFIIRQPIFALVWYVIITIMFLAIFCVCIWMFIENGKSSDDLIGMLILLPLLLLGPFLIIIWSRYKIIVKDNQITATSYFGKTKSFTFDYITRVEHGNRPTKMGSIDYIAAYHEKEKLFSPTSICPDFNVLVKCLKDKGAPFF